MYCALCGEIPGPGPLVARELRDAPTSDLARLVALRLSATDLRRARDRGKER